LYRRHFGADNRMFRATLIKYAAGRKHADAAEFA